MALAGRHLHNDGKVVGKVVPSIFTNADKHTTIVSNLPFQVLYLISGIFVIYSPVILISLRSPKNLFLIKGLSVLNR